MKHNPSQEKLVVGGTLLAISVSVEVMRVWAIRRGVSRLTGRDLSWMNALWITTLLRTAGGLLEEGRRQAEKYDAAIQKVRDEYVV